jgi:hypothetical protein
MSKAELKPHELMQKVADFCERESVPYRIVGSMASMAYGEPRFTNDVDVLVDLPIEKVDALCREFPAPDYYVAPHAVRQAISSRHQFNILHIPAGLKVDMILAADSEFDRLNLNSGQRLRSEGAYDALFASPENVILKKLVYYQEGGSEKHLRDISSILAIQGDKIDHAHLDKWASHLGVAEELQLVRQQAGEREK